MNEDNDAFGPEHRMRVGNATMGLLDACEDPELQQHLMDAGEALEKAARNLEDQGLDRREVWMTLIGLLLGPIIPD